MNLLAPITQENDMVSKAYVDGLLAEYTKTVNLGALASKDSLAFSELTGKPTTLAGYGVSNVDVSGYIKGGSTITCKGDLMSLTDDNQNYNWRIASIIDGAQLQVGYRDNSSNKGKFYFTGMWGEDLEAFFVRANGAYFDGADVYFRNTGKTQFAASALFQSGIKISAGQAISFLDSNGAEHKITYDEASQAFKIDGDLFTTGETSAGGKGSEAFDLASVLDRLAALEDNAAKNLAVDFSLLSSNIGDGKLQTVLNRIGFTTDVVNDLLDAKYNKVVGNGTYKEVWNYTAHETASYIEIYLRKGDDNLAGEWYNLHYLNTTQKWNITWGEI